MLSNGRSIGVLCNHIDVGFDVSSVMRVDNRVNVIVKELSEVSDRLPNTIRSPIRLGLD